MTKSKTNRVIVNYYTGEKWYLVSINGNETYVSEKEYKARTQGSEAKVSKVQPS